MHVVENSDRGSVRTVRKKDGGQKKARGRERKIERGGGRDGGRERGRTERFRLHNKAATCRTGSDKQADTFPPACPQ